MQSAGALVNRIILNEQLGVVADHPEPVEHDKPFRNGQFRQSHKKHKYRKKR